MKKLFIFAIAILGFSAVSFGQVTATASTSAIIITPIAIEKKVDMSFGNVSVSATGGTVILATNSTRTKTGGVTLPIVAGTVTSAKFTVTGLGTSTYSISLPTSDITLSDGATHTMTVGTFVSNPATTGTLASGTQDVYVGGTLAVGALQAAGTYTNASDLFVTVNYN